MPTCPPCGGASRSTRWLGSAPPWSSRSCGRGSTCAWPSLPAARCADRRPSLPAVDPELVDVRLVALPLDVWQRTQEHTDDLLREFTLVAQDEEARAAVPGRLLALIEE